MALSVNKVAFITSCFIILQGTGLEPRDVEEIITTCVNNGHSFCVKCVKH